MRQPSSSNQSLHVAVVGAGFSGLSAAIHLLEHGHRVTLYEASSHAGGRARTIQHPQTALDNGQHLCIGAYHSTLDLLEKAGVSVEDAFVRLPLRLEMYDGERRTSLVTPTSLPAPLHLLAGLLWAKGLTWQSKWSAVRWMTHVNFHGFKLTADCSVLEMLHNGRQTREAIHTLWEPLCLAALNTPIATASAQVFLNVLRDSLMQRRSDSDFLIARHDLSRALIEPLMRYIQMLGGEIVTGCTVKKLHTDPTSVTVTHTLGERMVDNVIIAVGPHQYKTLGLSDLPALNTLPITTVYLQFSHDIRLPYPLIGLTQGLGQWVFDRGQLCNQPGLLAVVISAHGDLPEKTALISQCVVALQQVLFSPQQSIALKPLWTKVITEKRATFACVSGLQRPVTDCNQGRVVLAGDAVENGYPATIEGAVRNGQQAARSIYMQPNYS